MKYLKFVLIELFVSIFIADIVLTNSTILSFVPYVFWGFHKFLALIIFNVSIIFLAKISSSWDKYFVKQFYIAIFVFLFIVLLIVYFTIIQNLEIKDFLIYFIPLLLVWFVALFVRIGKSESKQLPGKISIFLFSVIASIATLGLFFGFSYFDVAKKVGNLISIRNISSVIYFIMVYFTVIFGAIVPSSMQYSLLRESYYGKDYFPLIGSIIWAISINIIVFGFA